VKAMRGTTLFLKSIVILFVIIVGCTEKKTIYTYGQYSISDIDCGQRELVVRVLHPDRKILNGCDELKTVFENIAKKNITITPEMLAQYEAQLENRFPKAKRDKIKKIFGPDKESYQKIYLITESVQ
jgi:hypothetical protein